MNPTKRQSAAEEGSDERLGALLEKLHGSDDKLNDQLKDDRGASLQPKPVEDLDKLIPRVSRLDDKTSDDRVRAMESRTKRRSSRGFARFLVAICIGVVGTMAWQSYGEATKQIIAARAPELGWSPETKRMIANWVEQLGWTKPPAASAVRPSALETPQAAPVAQTAPENVTPAAPSIDPEQVHRMAMDLTALRQTVEQLAASQDKMVREVARLEAADAEILAKVTPAPPPPPPPIAAAPAVAERPAPGGAPSLANTQAEVALRANCGPDVQRLCRGISWENGGVIKCLNSHRMELSPICVAHFNGQKGRPKATSPNR